MWTITARKEVIMSAGSLNSAQLLMLSGIGPKWHLDQLGKLSNPLNEILMKLGFMAENKSRFKFNFMDEIIKKSIVNKNYEI